MKKLLDNFSFWFDSRWGWFFTNARKLEDRENQLAERTKRAK